LLELSVDPAVFLVSVGVAHVASPLRYFVLSPAAGAGALPLVPAASALAPVIVAAIGAAHVASPLRYFVLSPADGAGTCPCVPATVALAPVIAVLAVVSLIFFIDPFTLILETSAIIKIPPYN
jgi:hypothetical protein